MNFNLQQLLPFIAALAGTGIFWLLARLIFRNAGFQLGRGNYVGGLPQLGALLGLLALVPAGNFSAQFTTLIAAVALGLLIGLGEDLRKITPTQLMLMQLFGFALFFGYMGLSTVQLLQATLWCALIFVCLKLAALVYEMPFILTATSALTILIFFSLNHRSIESVLLTWAILACAIVFLVYSSTGNRVLTGSSGLAATALLLGTVSFLENSGRLLLFAMLIPTMVIVFPVFLISVLLIASYFGNKLHQNQSPRERPFSWTLEREMTVVFTGLIFLCLNFLGLLVELDAPWFGYLALLFLLAASLLGFFRTFARRQAEDVAEEVKQVRILGQIVDAVTTEDVLDRAHEFIVAPGTCGLMHIITADSLALLRCIEDKRFENVLNRAELVIPDGAGIVWASDFLGNPLPGRVPGVALVGDLCQMASEKGFRVFFLGGKPGIAEKAAEKLQQRLPNLSIAGIQHGFFKEESAEEEQVMKAIAESQADLVLVALGVPRQEWFISRLRLIGHKCVAVGIGGSFDVISETLPRAPIWMQRFGIEWLFRLWLEPFRIGRIAKIPAFVLQVLRYKWNNQL